MNKRQNAYQSFTTRQEQQDTTDTEEELRRATCGRKIQYDTRMHAQSAAEIVSFREPAFIVPYLCPFCGKWHIGHKHKRRV